MQKCVLKVNIHCDGCKHKVKKILQKIDGISITNTLVTRPFVISHLLFYFFYYKKEERKSVLFIYYYVKKKNKISYHVVNQVLNMRCVCSFVHQGCLPQR